KYVNDGVVVGVPGAFRGEIQEIRTPRRRAVVVLPIGDPFDTAVEVSRINMTARSVEILLAGPVDETVEHARVGRFAAALAGVTAVVAPLVLVFCHRLDERDPLAVAAPCDLRDAAGHVRHTFGFAAIGRDDPELDGVVIAAR